MKNTQKGFTLVELLVVIAILAILATVSVVGYTSFIESADKVPAEAGAEAAANLIFADMVTDNECKLGKATVNVAASDEPAVNKEVDVYVVKTNGVISYEGRYTEGTGASAETKTVALTEVAKITLRADNSDWSALTTNGGYLKLTTAGLSYCTTKYAAGVVIEVR